MRLASSQLTGLLGVQIGDTVVDDHGIEREVVWIALTRRCMSLVNPTKVPVTFEQV